MNKQTIWRRLALGFAVVMLLAAFAAMQATSVYQAAVSMASHGQVTDYCPSLTTHC